MAVIIGPGGTKGRTESHRRYILCREVTNVGQVVVVKRSDNLATIRRQFDQSYPGEGFNVFVWDRVAQKIPTRAVFNQATGHYDQRLMVKPQKGAAA